MITLRSVPTFPSSVTGSEFIAVTAQNGAWTISPKFELLAIPVLSNLQQIETVVRDTITGVYGRVPLAVLVGASSFPTNVTGNHPVAPNETYLRCNLSAPATITLGDSAARSGLKLGIKDVAGTFATNNATITFFGSQTADGKSSITLDQNFEYLELVPNAAGWEITHYG